MLLLHLADIHFRTGEAGTAMDPNARLRDQLMEDAHVQVQALGGKVDAILVAGDIAYQADPEEYKFAFEWFERLCEKCGTTAAAMFVVPGNHDIDQKVTSRKIIQAIHKDIKAANEISREAVLRGLLTDKETGRFLYESLDSYNAFANRFCSRRSRSEPPCRSNSEPGRKLTFA